MKNLVWLASYPRSGNTWLRAFLSSLLSEQSKNTGLIDVNIGLIANSRIMFDDLSGIDSANLTRDEINHLRPAVFQLLSKSSEELVYLKTHDKFDKNQSGKAIFPSEHSFGCIYLIRNPLDVAVSNAHYFCRDMDDMVNCLNKSHFLINFRPNAFYPIMEEHPGTWSEHVKSWMDSGLNTLFVRYEDLISKPFQTFSKVLDFLGLEYPEHDVQKAINEAAFENLQKKEKLQGFKEKFQNANAFFRNGKSGNWKNELTEIQIDKIIKDHREVMYLMGYLDKNGHIIDSENIFS